MKEHRISDPFAIKAETVFAYGYDELLDRRYAVERGSGNVFYEGMSRYPLTPYEIRMAKQLRALGQNGEERYRQFIKRKSLGNKSLHREFSTRHLELLLSEALKLHFKKQTVDS